jgi:formate dehydrogenase iron-sulfur subunit
LVAEAQQRIHDNPGQYVNHIYGLEEVGGTSVLLLSAVPFETFGYRTDIAKDPLPMLTYRVLSHIPDFVPLGGMLLGGVWWITHRREEVAEVEGREKKNGGKR